MNQEKLNNIAYANARKIISENNLDVDLHELAESLLPKIEEAEQIRLAEKASMINDLFEEKIKEKKEEKKKVAVKNKNDIQLHSRFDEELSEDTSIYKALVKKSESSEVPIEIIGEVFDRGYNAWDDSQSVTQEQYAFARVNSYINKGRTYREDDADLQELSKDTLKSYVNKATKDKENRWKKSAEAVGKASLNYDNEKKKDAYNKEADNQMIKSVRRSRNIDKAEKKLSEGTHSNTFGNSNASSIKARTHRRTKDLHDILNKRDEDAKKKEKKVTEELDSQSIKIKKLNRKFRDQRLRNKNKLAGNKEASLRNDKTLEELSTDALERYKTKANKSKKNALGRADRAYMNYDGSTKDKDGTIKGTSGNKYDTAMDIVDKREKGIANATSKISKKRLKENEDVSKNNRLGEPNLVKKYLARTPGQEKAQVEPKDPKTVKEEVKSADRIAVVVPSFKDENGNVIPSKTHWRKASRKIIGSGSVTDGK